MVEPSYCLINSKISWFSVRWLKKMMMENYHGPLYKGPWEKQCDFTNEMITAYKGIIQRIVLI